MAILNLASTGTTVILEVHVDLHVVLRSISRISKYLNLYTKVHVLQSTSIWTLFFIFILQRFRDLRSYCRTTKFSSSSRILSSKYRYRGTTQNGSQVYEQISISDLNQISIRKFFQMRRAGKGFDALNLVLNFV